MLALQSLLQDFVEVLFPTYCVACQQGLVKGEQHICTTCQHQLPQTDFYKSPSDNPLFQKLSVRVPIKYAVAYWQFQKKGKVQRILHHLKYNGNAEIGYQAGLWFGQLLKEQTGLSQALDWVVPIPLHPAKLRQRGYNQSDGIAKGIAELLEVPWSNQLIKRSKFTESQTRKDKLERWQNVSGIFQTTDPSKITNKRFLLVDDVVTTGSTFEALIVDLLEQGAKEVSIAALAAA